MESLRRPVVYRGVTYTEYEMDFYTSNVYSMRFDGRIMKPTRNRDGYLYFFMRVEGRRIVTQQHQLLVETFPDLISKSPVVSHYGLQRGQDRHELKTPMGFTFICNMICPDHIDSNRVNNHHSNLMIVTQFENIIKCEARKGRKYKGITKRPHKRYSARIAWVTILDKNGKPFCVSKNFKTEEEAALAYNTMLEESLLTIFGLDLGPKLYDLAYKNEVPTPVQQQLILK